MAAPPSPRPGPVTDEDSGNFWMGVRRHELLLQRCDACGAVRFPPGPRCLECASDAATLEPSSGAGTVYSWIRVERPVGSIRPEEVPLAFVTVELDEGPRMVGRWADGGEVAIGERAGVLFMDWSDWTEVRFGPESEMATS